jgi:hypothetical protein
LFFDRRLTLKNVLITRIKLKNARKMGNQTCSWKLEFPDPTIIPAIAKINIKTIITIRVQHAEFESYQDVMVFLKNGFWSNCIYTSIK